MQHGFQSWTPAIAFCVKLFFNIFRLFLYSSKKQLYKNADLP